jgi:hypothetical protein
VRNAGVLTMFSGKWVSTHSPKLIRISFRAVWHGVLLSPGRW